MFTLDVGCGELKLGDVNIDIRRQVKPDVVADAQYLPIKKEAFDRVACFEVIEHVDSPFLVLKEIQRVMKLNGDLVVSTPNPYLWIRLLREIVPAKRTIFTQHIFCFTKTELENLAQKIGFHVAYVDYTNPSWYKRYWKPLRLGKLLIFLDKFFPTNVLGKRHIVMVCKK